MNTNNLALSGKYPPLELKLTSQGCCGKEVGWNCGCALVRSMDTRVRMWRQCTRGLPVSIIFTEQQLMRFFYSMVVLFNALCKQTYPTPLWTEAGFWLMDSSDYVGSVLCLSGSFYEMRIAVWKSCPEYLYFNGHHATLLLLLELLTRAGNKPSRSLKLYNLLLKYATAAFTYY